MKYQIIYTLVAFICWSILYGKIAGPGLPILFPVLLLCIYLAVTFLLSAFNGLKKIFWIESVKFLYVLSELIFYSLTFILLRGLYDSYSDIKILDMLLFIAFIFISFTYFRFAFRYSRRIQNKV